MSIETGTYTILNVRYNNVAYVADLNDGSPVTGVSPSLDAQAQWIVTRIGSSFYTIRNAGTNTAANTGNRSKVGDMVDARSIFPAQEFSIMETRVPGNYTISTTDTDVVWRLDDNQPYTPVTLANTYTDQRAWWIFQIVGPRVMKPIPAGTYTIVNVRHNNVAFVADTSDGTPVTAVSPVDNPKARWILNRNGNFYTIVNAGTHTAANTGNRAKIGGTVESRSNLPRQEFDIQETRVPHKYTISTTDTDVVWRLDDNQQNTPITLANTCTDQRAWWMFELVRTQL